MINKFKLFAVRGFAVISLMWSASCQEIEDPGPLQDAEEQYAIVDFDRLEVGDALIIKVEQSEFFTVSASGDRRNVNDLKVYKDGNTLVIRYDENSNRRHDTYISITMPELRSAHFSGASNSTVSGFTGNEFDLYLSGASVCQLSVESQTVNAVLSGASDLTLTGEGAMLNVEASGASKVNGYRFSAEKAVVNVSGASSVKVSVLSELQATASGASVISYRGEPETEISASGSSQVLKD